MIAFREGWNPNDDDALDALVDKLKKILSNSPNAFSPFAEEEAQDDQQNTFHYSVNISDIIEIIYDNLYQKDNEVISLLINKNPKNSLDVYIDYIK